MSGRPTIGLRSGAVLFLALSASFGFGCSGNSNSGDEEDGDAGEGSGGTSSFGGTTARGGGAGVLGGGGSGQSTCRSVCERSVACPNAEPADCVSECAAAEQDAAAAGCTLAYQNYLDCTGALPDVCAFDGTQCTSQAEALVACLNGSPSCGVGSLPANSSCSALCPRLDACPDATTTCLADCAASDEQASATGCSVQYQALMGCASTCADICALGEYDCVTQVDSYVNCILTYCAANPSATPCL